MEFVLPVLGAVWLGFRGWRAGRRTYGVLAVMTTVVALYLYHY